MGIENLPDSGRALERLRIHFFYVVLILIAAIILLATRKWTAIEKFTDYLTAAGTMISIVLGVLAIIYSFVSGDSISKSLGNVASTIHDLQAARKELTDVVDAASDLATVSRLSSNELNSVLDNVRREVEELKMTSSQLNTSTEGIAKVVGQMPERLDNIASRLDETLKNSKPSGMEPIQLQEPLAEKLLKKCSIYGVAILYASALSLEKNKVISLRTKPFVEDTEYCYGFITAVNAVGILIYDVEKKLDRRFQTIAFPITSAQVLEKTRERFRDRDEELRLVEDMFKDIDFYFSET
jgi:hypothetical protein